MSKFQVQGGSAAPGVLKFTAGGWDGPALQKDSIEANMSNVYVTNPNTDGDVLDLARKIARVFRQTIAPATGVSSMTMPERRALRDKIVAAMTQEQDSPFADDHSQATRALVQIASLLAGLTEELQAPEKSTLGKSFGNNVETNCPFCKKPNSFAKDSGARVDAYGLQILKCTHCEKSWSGNLDLHSGLEKRATSPELEVLKTQVRGQLTELLGRINKLLEDQKATKFDSSGNRSAVKSVVIPSGESRPFQAQR